MSRNVAATSREPPKTPMHKSQISIITANEICIEIQYDTTLLLFSIADKIRKTAQNKFAALSGARNSAFTLATCAATSLRGA